MNTFHFHILTLNGVVYEGDVVNVYVDTTTGILGCLPNRAPCIAALKKNGSVFKFQDINGRTRYFVTLGGAFEMKNNEAFVLGEKCQEVNSEEEGEKTIEKLRMSSNHSKGNEVLKAKAEILAGNK